MGLGGEATLRGASRKRVSAGGAGEDHSGDCESLNP